MATATAMYHSGKNPLRGSQKDATVFTAKSPRDRRLHKAFLRYHDPNNWPLLRSALKRLGRADLIGPSDRQLVPAKQPPGWQKKTAQAAVDPRKRKTFRTQHVRQRRY